MSDPTWISILPPVTAIVLAIWSRQVYLSLAGGILLGWTILNDWNPLTGLAVSVDATVDVFTRPGDTKVLLFTLVIGAMIATIEYSGGVRGFVQWLETRQWVTSAKGAQFLAWATGVVIFIESNITVLVAGAVARPLIDRYKSSREKLAYLIDSTSAPICILIPLNAWGAYNLGILGGLGVENPLQVFLQSILFNFYSIAAVLLSLSVVLFGFDIGPMKAAEARAAEGKVLRDGANPMIDEGVLAAQTPEGVTELARNMTLPIAAMVLFMPLGLWITGSGNMIEGDGSTSVLWAVMAGLAVSWILLLSQKAFSVDQLMKTGAQGGGGPGAARSDPAAVDRVEGRDQPVGHRSLRGRGDDGRSSAGRLPAPRLSGRGRDRLLHGHQLGHLRDHASHCRAGCRDHGAAAGALRCGVPFGGDLRRSLLADFRHDHHLVDGRRDRPHRSRTHAAAVRPDRWGDRHGRLRDHGSADQLIRGPGGHAGSVRGGTG